jgi:hypothetical protein
VRILQLAILLPPKQPFAQAQRDLEGFLGVLRTREMLEVASQKPATGGETVHSIAVRLAFEVEKMLDAEVAVSIRRPRGAQVVATSVRADPHLARLVAVPGSAVDLAVSGEVTQMVMATIRSVCFRPDRRLRERRAFVLPILSSSGPLGALGGVASQRRRADRSQSRRARRRASPRGSRGSRTRCSVSSSPSRLCVTRSRDSGIVEA